MGWGWLKCVCVGGGEALAKSAFVCLWAGVAKNDSDNDNVKNSREDS